MSRILFFLTLVALLAGCASAPTRTTNACAVLDQKNGFFTNWERSVKKAEREYGIPTPVILATMYAESNFKHNARPPRTKLLGFIPWKRQSSAYGYAQALDGTWDRYRRETGRTGAKRNNFEDAARFIAWYHRQSVQKNGVAPHDAYNLYLNYYLGHTGYARGNGRGGIAARGAQRAQTMSRQYDMQLRQCGRR
ncbi:hypothetical protein N5853_04330 [Bartonella sp. HY329]|uniref:transglycosylase SLT domain-containing protein n=1 Tax=unclassified Bartonella TaxID=2645622 RepID=UPI0021C8D518|nr:MULTISPECIES: hypothetical protein [unclassified Bartonella]UXM95857.1 hypothetical protein N5853_04330 [Bartonella sp. HY329]UXN10182.1 hypothetical protein N5852_04340 [Bartonella sp. HY328]